VPSPFFSVTSDRPVPFHNPPASQALFFSSAPPVLPYPREDRSSPTVFSAPRATLPCASRVLPFQRGPPRFRLILWWQTWCSSAGSTVHPFAIGPPRFSPLLLGGAERMVMTWSKNSFSPGRQSTWRLSSSFFADFLAFVVLHHES